MPVATSMPAAPAARIVPGDAATPGVDRRRLPDPEPPTVSQVGFSHGPGIERPHLTFEFVGAAGQIEACVGLGDLAGVGRRRVVLGTRNNSAGEDVGQYLAKQYRAKLSQRVVQPVRRHAGVDTQRAACIDRSRVESRLHPHDADSGLGIAGKDRALDRRGAAPARQQGSVNIDARATRPLEQPARQQQPVSGDDERIGRRPPGFGQPRIAERRRLLNSEAQLFRGALDRRRGEFTAAPGAAIRLRQHERNRRCASGKLLEHGNREFGRPGECDSDWFAQRREQPVAEPRVAASPARRPPDMARGTGTVSLFERRTTQFSRDPTPVDRPSSGRRFAQCSGALATGCCCPQISRAEIDCRGGVSCALRLTFLSAFFFSRCRLSSER